MPPVLPDLPALLVRQAQRVRRVPRAPPGLLVLPDPLAQRVPPDLPALPGQPVLLDLLGLPVQLERRVPPALRAPPVPPALPAQRALLLRQYMHNTEIAVTMRLSTILKTIKQPL